MTRRSAGFFALLLILYLAANYTRVGWLYVFTAGLVALLLLSWIWARLALRGIGVARSVTDPSGRAFSADAVAPCEGEAALVSLRFSGIRFPRLLVTVTDPALGPGPAGRAFLPALIAATRFARPVAWERRGVVEMAAIDLESVAPFGLFRARRRLAAPGRVTVYPRWYPAPDGFRAAGLDADMASSTRSGSGGVFLGTRDYRPGDPLRAVHWRSSVRRGRLVVKEFEDDAHPVLTIAVDGATDAGVPPRSQLDDAVRLAAGALRWATERGITVNFAGPEAPRAAVDWRRGMEYLARVRSEPDAELAGALAGMAPTPALIVLSPQVDPAAERALTAWRRAGTRVVYVGMLGYGGSADAVGGGGQADVVCGPASDLAVVTALLIGMLQPTAARPRAAQ